MDLVNLISSTHKVISALNDFRDLESILRDVKSGDILEFHRGVYSHYALYIGKDSRGTHMVANICAESKAETRARIKRLPLEEVAGESKIKISNHDDIAWKYFSRSPRRREQVLEAASKYWDEDWEYAFMEKNCEYYCTLWRFGVGFSTQVANAVELQMEGTSRLQPFPANLLGAVTKLFVNPYDKYLKIANLDK